MNLSKLFETQRVLDTRIMDKHPELVGQNNLDWKVLALQVELGECANEWRGFKKWSNDQEPRREVEQYGFADPGGPFRYLKYPLLEEYVDCLHFILSIGLEFKYNLDELHLETNMRTHKYDDIIIQFVWLGNTVSNLFIYRERDYDLLIYEFISLGEMLGFTWEQIEQAYYDKNAINHTRQNTGY